MKIFTNLLLPAVSITKARVLCALAGFVCAVLVSTLIVPNPQNAQASMVPQNVFVLFFFTPCGEGCYMVGCVDICTANNLANGVECCYPGVDDYLSCLYCGQ